MPANPLHEYYEKRDFPRTPEPGNDDRRPPWAESGMIFIVQKHDASTLPRRKLTRNDEQALITTKHYHFLQFHSSSFSCTIGSHCTCTQLEPPWPK